MARQVGGLVPPMPGQQASRTEARRGEGADNGAEIERAGGHERR